MAWTEFTNGTTADADEVNANFDRVPQLLYSGVITLQTDTTADDVDYLDIDFSASDMAATDMIKIEVVGMADDQTVTQRLMARETTTTGQINNNAVATSGQMYRASYILVQDQVTNDLIDSFFIRNSEDTQDSDNQQFDTNDANVFTTGFTFRLNFKNAGTASNDSKHRYNVWLIRDSA